MKKEIGLSALLVALCLAVCAVDVGRQVSAGASFGQLALPRFLTATNLSNTANLIGIFSIGLGFIIITGGIDLSVGSMFALGGVLLSMALTRWHWPWPVAALGALAVPMALGWAHGALVTRLRIQPFIVTLCGLLIYRGLARFIADDVTMGFGSSEGFEALHDLAR